MNAPLLSVENVTKHFPVRRGLMRRVTGAVQAVTDVSFTLGAGETLARAHAAGSTSYDRYVGAVAQSTAVDVAGKAMQLHGGIGYTWESGLHVYLKRAMLNRSLYGSPAFHRKRLSARYG